MYNKNLSMNLCFLFSCPFISSDIFAEGIWSGLSDEFDLVSLVKQQMCELESFFFRQWSPYLFKKRRRMEMEYGLCIDSLLLIKAEAAEKYVTCKDVFFFHYFHLDY